MSNVSKNLDTSGGSMPPPSNEDVRPKQAHFKKYGKGHKHESCDACGKAGNLICCNKCPVSFHLGCHDPPLDENDMSAGLWLCRECSTRRVPAPPPVEKSRTPKRTRRSRKSRSNSKKKSKDSDEPKEPPSKKEKPLPEPEEEPVEEKVLTPMEMLIKAAHIMNPAEFESDDVQIPIIFPRTEKVSPADKVRGRVTTDAAGVFGAVCHACKRTCRVAPLLQCDYCPLFFHQDCVNPPLTTLPTGRWMCPKHDGPSAVDWDLVNSLSSTERVALWDRYTIPVSRQAVKIDFLNEASNKARSSMLPVEGAPLVNVPGTVRVQYADPPSIMPTEREYVRCKKVLENQNPEAIYADILKPDSPQRSMSENPQSPEEEYEVDPATDIETPNDEECNEEEEDEKLPKSDGAYEPSDSESSSSLDSDKFAPVCKRPRMQPSPVHAAPAPDPDLDQLLAVIDERFRHIDEGVVKILAWERLQQVLAGERACDSKGGDDMTRAADRIVRNALPPDPVQALPTDLLSSADRERITTAVLKSPSSPSVPPPPPSPPPPPPPSSSSAPAKATRYKVQAAVVTLGSDLNNSVSMNGASFRIGTGADCDLRLDRTKCRRVSKRHAVIFVDKVSGNYELINYSEHGTVVNGVLYACDVEVSTSARSLDEPSGSGCNADGTRGEDTEAKEEALRDIVRHRMPRPIIVTGDITTSANDFSPCRCDNKTGAGALGAWEGAALVPHGALLNFGCLQYIFSIVHEEPVPAL